MNVHPPDGCATAGARRPARRCSSCSDRTATSTTDASGNRALAALLASGRDVFVERGYHNTRVDDLVAAAGVSHGAFYRYFRNKDQLARMLTARAVHAVGAAVIEIPDLASLEGASTARACCAGGSAAITRRTPTRPRCCASGSMPRSKTRRCRADSAPLLDWGRRRMARSLRPRAFGDVDIDAVVMVALLGVFGARQRPAAEIDAAVHIIERGLLGR